MADHGEKDESERPGITGGKVGDPANDPFADSVVSCPGESEPGQPVRPEAAGADKQGKRETGTKRAAEDEGNDRGRGDWRNFKCWL